MMTSKPPAAAIAAARPLSEQSPYWAGPGFWNRYHEAKLAEVAAGPREYDCAFVGDSITHNWVGWSHPADVSVAAAAYADGVLKFPVGPGRAVWNEMKKSATLLNLGVGGDCTQHTLWRLDHGEMDGYRTRFVFLMIGTNNVDDTPEDRAEGIRAVIAKIAEKQPSATILLSPIFPCGATPDDPGRMSRDRTNAIIQSDADGSHVVWVDFTAKFLNEDGTLAPEMMPDYLHPLEAGYRIWRDEIARFLF